MLRFLFVVALVLVGFRATGEAQLDPRGIYYMQQTVNGNPTTFTEWFSVIPLGGNNYMFRDFFGYGWNGTVTPSGNILIEGQFPGSFNGPDAFSTQVGAGPNALYNCTRCAGTDVEFATLLPGPTMMGDPAYDGDYMGSTDRLDPQSGALIQSTPETLTLLVTGNRLRITRPNGSFFEGVFYAPDTVSFRVIGNTVTGWLPAFATHPGTSTSGNNDLVGEVRFPDPNSFVATLCVQTREAIGQQSQFLFSIQGTRDPGGAAVPGDFDADSSIDVTDPIQLLSHLFGSAPTVLPCDSPSVNVGNNLEVFDADGNGSVDVGDVVYLLQYVFNIGAPHVLGEDCLPIAGCNPTPCP